MTLLLCTFIGAAQAEPPKAGSGAVRLGAGAGVSEIGGAGRIGADGEVWVLPRLAVGARAAGGIDGLVDGRTLLLGEVLVPVRPLGGNDLALVLVPGLGVAWHSEYETNAEIQGTTPAVSAETTPQGFVSSASLALQLQGRMGFLSLAMGPRVETYAFRTASATFNVGLGVGW